MTKEVVTKGKIGVDAVRRLLDRMAYNWSEYATEFAQEATALFHRAEGGDNIDQEYFALEQRFVAALQKSEDLKREKVKTIAEGQRVLYGSAIVTVVKKASVTGKVIIFNPAKGKKQMVSAFGLKPLPEDEPKEKPKKAPRK